MSDCQMIKVIAMLYIGAMLTIASGVLLYAGLGLALIVIGCFLMLTVFIVFVEYIA